MKYLLTLMIATLLLLPNAARGDDPVAAVRAELLKQGQAAQVEDSLRRWYLELVSHDSVPLSEDSVASLFSSARQDREAFVRRTGVVQVWLLRHHDNVEKLVWLYSRMDDREKNLLAGLMCGSIYKPLINERHAPVVFLLVSDHTRMSQDPRLPRDVREARLQVARSLVDFAMKLDRKATAKYLVDTWTQEVVAEEPRREITFEALAGGGRDVLPLAVWYFGQYCFQPFETKVLTDYLRRNLPDDEYRAIVAVKQSALRETLDVLAGKTTASTSMPVQNSSAKTLPK